MFYFPVTENQICGRFDSLDEAKWFSAFFHNTSFESASAYEYLDSEVDYLTNEGGKKLTNPKAINYSGLTHKEVAEFVSTKIA